MGSVGGVFITCAAVLIVFNLFYVISGFADLEMMVVGGVLGILLACIPTIVVGSINVFGSGLNSASVKMLFTCSALLSILFRIEIPNTGLGIGLGLCQNVIDLFPITEFFGIGFLVAMGLGLITLITGIMTVADSGV